MKVLIKPCAFSSNVVYPEAYFKVEGAATVEIDKEFKDRIDSTMEAFYKLQKELKELYELNK
jgi:hypothetical protein